MTFGVSLTWISSAETNPETYLIMNKKKFKEKSFPANQEMEQTFFLFADFSY